MNILFFLRKVDCNDGISAYCENLIKGLNGHGHRVFIASGPVSFDKNSEIRRNSIAANLASWTIFGKVSLVPFPKEVFTLISLIRTSKIDVIHAHGLSMCLWGKLLGLLCRKPVVITYHPSAHGDLANVRAMAAETIGLKKRAYLRLFFPDSLIVLSEENRKHFADALPSLADRVQKIYGGIDTTYFRVPSPDERLLARQWLNYGESDFVCLLLGRLSWNKGQDVLIAAAAILQKDYPEIPLKCLLVGDGERREAIEALVAAQDPGGQVFAIRGFIKDIRHAVWAADMLVLPSRVEGFALVVAEGMATGLVPVRTPTGGAIDQIIEGETGFVIPFEDAAALARAIVLVYDPQRRGRMSTRCIDHAQTNFSQENMAERTIALYERLQAGLRQTTSTAGAA